MSAHTPGPWKVQALATWIQTEGDPYGHGPMRIADVRGWGHLTGRGACRLDEDEAVAIQTANARLIAAAPEMADAIRAFLAQWAVVVPHIASAFVLQAVHGAHYTGPHVAEEVSRLRDVLAKATEDA